MSSVSVSVTATVAPKALDPARAIRAALERMRDCVGEARSESRVVGDTRTVHVRATFRQATGDAELTARVEMAVRELLDRLEVQPATLEVRATPS